MTRVRRASCCSPSAARRGRTTSCRSCATSPAAAGIPDERLAEVAEHYHHFGGVSPINAQNRALIAALRAEFDRARHRAADLLGQPQLEARTSPTRCGGCATTGVARRAGVRHQRDRRPTPAAGSTATTSPRRARVAGDGRAGAGQAAALLRPSRLRRRQRRRACARRWPRCRASTRDDARLVFTAHSIPVTMNADVRAAARRAVPGSSSARPPGWWPRRCAAPGAEFDLVWQSRSGPPQVPWLEPDINDHLRVAGRRRASAPVVVAPTGFVSDHLEVLLGPRHRGAGDRGRARPAPSPGPAPPARTRRSSR